MFHWDIIIIVDNIQHSQIRLDFSCESDSTKMVKGVTKLDVQESKEKTEPTIING